MKEYTRKEDSEPTIPAVTHYEIRGKFAINTTFGENRKEHEFYGKKGP